MICFQICVFGPSLFGLYPTLKKKEEEEKCTWSIIPSYVPPRENTCLIDLMTIMPSGRNNSFLRSRKKGVYLVPTFLSSSLFCCCCFCVFENCILFHLKSCLQVFECFHLRRLGRPEWHRQRQLCVYI